MWASQISIFVEERNGRHAVVVAGVAVVVVVVVVAAHPSSIRPFIKQEQKSGINTESLDPFVLSVCPEI